MPRQPKSDVEKVQRLLARVAKETGLISYELRAPLGIFGVPPKRSRTVKAIREFQTKAETENPKTEE
jgi:hypothetical protein